MRNINFLLIYPLLIIFFNCCKEKENIPKVETKNVIHVWQTTAQVKGFVVSEGSSYLYRTGVCYNTTGNPDILDSVSIVKSISTDDTLIISLGGLKANTNYYVKFFAENSVGIAYGNEIIFTTKEIVGFIDIRDGQVYNTVEINNQTWLAQNLNYNTKNGSWYYENDSNKYASVYGKLYSYETAKNVCPEGWHLPSDTEWGILEKNIGVDESELYEIGQRGTNVGGKLKDISDNYWISVLYESTNETGFTALPGGMYIKADNSFYGIGKYAIFWTSTEFDIDTTNGIYRELFFKSSINRGFSIKSAGFSVRCIKN